MKLNPFRKKGLGRHFEKLQAEYNDLDRQLQSARQAHEDAIADLEEKRLAYRELEARSNTTFWSPQEQRLKAQENKAEHRVSETRAVVSDLQDKLRPIIPLVFAPSEFAEAKDALEKLIAHGNALTADFIKTNAAIEKLSKRDADLEQRIQSETEAAAKTIEDGEGELILPVALTQLDNERRVVQTSIAGLHKKLETLRAESKPLPAQIQSARETFIGSRAQLAELELAERLPEFMEVIARAAVSRHLSCYSQKADRYEITLPYEVIEKMTEILNAEVPA